MNFCGKDACSKEMITLLKADYINFPLPGVRLKRKKMDIEQFSEEAIEEVGNVGECSEVVPALGCRRSKSWKKKLRCWKVTQKLS